MRTVFRAPNGAPVGERPPASNLAVVDCGPCALEFGPLWPTLGARVTGIDLSAPLDGEVVRQLRRGLAVYGALLFGDQELDPDAEERAFSCFDRIETSSPYGEDFRVPGHPAIRVLSNMVQGGLRLGIVMGKQGPEWHCDGASRPVRPVASQLYCLESNSFGGDTLFANGATAYETLSPELKRLADRAVCVYNSDHLQAKLSIYDQREIKLSGAPDVEHRLVLANPDTGRRALYFAWGELVAMKGVNERERQILVEGINEHLFSDPHISYRHRWLPGDLFVWDNRTVIHSATYYDYEGHPRLLHHLSGAGRREDDGAHER